MFENTDAPRAGEITAWKMFVALEGDAVDLGLNYNYGSTNFLLQASFAIAQLSIESKIINMMPSSITRSKAVQSPPHENAA